MKNILVVGGGLIGARHVKSVRAHERCAFAGLVDPAPDTGARYQCLSQVDDKIDGVIIATPTDLHAEHGIYAADRGWHMLIEKPVARDLAQADALDAAVKRAGVASLVGHHRRYHSHIQHLKSVIADGTIGPVVTASMIWAMRKPDSYFDYNWRTTGGSPVMINTVHDVDLLRFVLSAEISDVAAIGGASLRGTSRVESGAVALLFDNGATGTISFADTALSPWGFEAATAENPNIGATGQDMLWITGTKGAISFPSMTMWAGAADWGQPVVARALAYPKDRKMPLDKQLDHFVDVMSGTAKPLINADDARRSLAAALLIESRLTRRAA